MSKKFRNLGWGLRKSDALVPDPEKSSPSRKDKRKWCRGKVGIEHVLVVRRDKSRYRSGDKCKWTPWMLRQDDPWWWSCSHEVGCVNCGKVMRRVKPEECPETAPKPTGEVPCSCGHGWETGHHRDWRTQCKFCDCTRFTWRGHV